MYITPLLSRSELSVTIYHQSAERIIPCLQDTAHGLLERTALPTLVISEHFNLTWLMSDIQAHNMKRAILLLLVSRYGLLKRERPWTHDTKAFIW